MLADDFQNIFLHGEKIIMGICKCEFRGCGGYGESILKEVNFDLILKQDEYIFILKGISEPQMDADTPRELEEVTFFYEPLSLAG